MTQVQEKEKTPFLRLILVLFLITAIAAALLAAVNEVTYERIAQLAAEKLNAAMLEIQPEADSFLLREGAEYDTVSGVYLAQAGGETIGYCVETTPNGFGGAMSVLVGIDLEGKVTGVKLVDHSETAGVGTRAEDPAFLAQYVGRSGSVSLGGAEGIDAVSGATITSKAVTRGVNAALAAAEQEAAK